MFTSSIALNIFLMSYGFSNGMNILSKRCHWVFIQRNLSNLIWVIFKLNNYGRESRILTRWKASISVTPSILQDTSFREVRNLEKLILEGCTKLHETDQSVGVLESLVLLNLKDCKKLASLPKSIYGLKALKTFNLSGCSKLEDRLDCWRNWVMQKVWRSMI